MRAALVASAAAAVALRTGAIAAAGLRPAALTLQQSDVPPAFPLDASETTNLAPDAPALGSFGLVSGRYTAYRNTDPPTWRTIKSIVFVLRRADGAERLLVTFGRQVAAERPLARRRTVAIGAHGSLYADSSSSTVVWRHGRVVAVVVCEKVAGGPRVALPLARAQERRIAAALR